MSRRNGLWEAFSISLTFQEDYPKERQTAAYSVAERGSEVDSEADSEAGGHEIRGGAGDKAPGPIHSRQISKGLYCLPNSAINNSHGSARQRGRPHHPRSVGAPIEEKGQSHFPRSAGISIEGTWQTHHPGSSGASTKLPRLSAIGKPLLPLTHGPPVETDRTPPPLPSRTQPESHAPLHPRDSKSSATTVIANPVASTVSSTSSSNRTQTPVSMFAESVDQLRLESLPALWSNAERRLWTWPTVSRTAHDKASTCIRRCQRRKWKTFTRKNQMCVA